MAISVTSTHKRELIDITSKIQAEISEGGVSHGFCYLWIPHTTAAITVNEGADPMVQDDILMALDKMVPANLPYKHTEGNAQAHVLSAIIGCSKVLWIEDGKLALGTWQKVFCCEFDGPRTRKVHLRLVPIFE